MRLLTGTILILLFFVGRAFNAELTIPDLEKSAPRSRDATLFYDLGVLYANSGNTGKAILNFKKARLLDPSDRETGENLNALRQTIGIPPYFSEGSPIEKAVLLPFSVFSLNGGLIFGLVLFIAGSLGLSFVLSQLKRFAFSGKIKIGSIVTLVIGLVYISASLIRFQFTFDPRNAVLLADCSLLERPDAESIPLSDVPGGMECVVRDINGGYARVNTLDGHEGWVIRTNVERLWEGEQ